MRFRENIQKTEDRLGWTLLTVVWLFVINSIFGLFYDHQPLFMYYVPVILILINTFAIPMLSSISYENNSYD